MRVNDIYLSIQGEDLEAGLPTVFVRTARCNLRCKWCDTHFKEPCKIMPENLVVEEVRLVGRDIKRVCVTGGEPLLEEDMLDFLEHLARKDYEISVETNGSIDVQPFLSYKIVMDIKCPSSGMTKYMFFHNLCQLKASDQVKFVIEDKNDYYYAKRIVKEFKTQANILFSPVFDKELRIARRLSKWIIKDRLPVRLNLQIHKLLLMK